MKLAELLKKENNNLDVFRLIAAGMVIYGHAYAIAPQAGQTDWIGRMLEYDYSGSLAVKIFFFLSGLVVTNSLLQKRNAVDFAISRFFRIWPGLLAVLVVSALLVVPFFSALSFSDYFSSSQPYRYILKNTFLQLDYDLPGAFLNSPHNHAVNGSLWTVPMEVGAYIGLLALFLLGVFRSPKLTVGVFLLLMMDPLTGNRLLFTWKSPSFHSDYFIPCFAIGAMLAYFKEHIEIGAGIVMGSILIYLLFQASSYKFYFFYMALFLSIVYLSGTPLLRRLKLRSDYSFGVYLWGFPVQQILQQSMPEKGTQFNQLASLVVALILGYLSWHLVEKRGIAFGQKLIGLRKASVLRSESPQLLATAVK